MLCTWNRVIVYRGKGLLIGWVQRQEHFETASSFLRCAKGGCGDAENLGVVQGRAKGRERQDTKGRDFQKTSHKTAAVVSHSGTHSQISDRSVTLTFEFSIKPLSNDYKILRKGI